MKVAARHEPPEPQAEDAEPRPVDLLLGAASRLAATIATTEQITQRRADLLNRSAAMRGPIMEPAGKRAGFISLADAAKRTGRHPEVLRRWCMEGRIPAVRIGRTWAIGPETLTELIAHSARSRPRFPTASS